MPAANANTVDNSAIYASRDIINKKLVENLSMYGNLEPPGHSWRTYNAGSKSRYQFSAANYLRMAVASRECGYTDNRWISEAYVKKWDVQLRSDAKFVELEYWHNEKDKQGYKGELKKFYNVTDVLNKEVDPKEFKVNQPDDIEYAVDLLKAGGSGIVAKNANVQTVFNAAKGLAKLHGADEFTATLTGQLVLKQSHLEMDYTKQPLFDEKQLARLEHNPKIIFSAMRSAQKELYKMQYALEQDLKKDLERAKNERDLKEHIKNGGNSRKEPFKDLTVKFLWSEAEIKDFSGQPYEENTELKGEKAYEFLAQLNAADKEAFDRKLLGGGYEKTKIELTYKDYEHGEMRIDLGDLELKNKSSIAEALSNRLNAYRQHLLDDPSAAQMYLHSHPEETLEKMREDCQHDIAECNKLLEEFKQEEMHYLAVHPEVAEINARKANTFKYKCPAAQLGKIRDGVVLQAAPAEKYPGATDLHSQSIPDDHVIFESAISPDSEWMEKLRKEGIEPILTQEAIKAITNLEKNLKLEVKDYGSVLAPSTEPRVETYKGVQAAVMFGREKVNDAKMAKDALIDKRFHRQSMHQKEITLSFGDRQSLPIRYEMGTGEFQKLEPVEEAMDCRSKNKIPLHGYEGAEKDAAEVMKGLVELTKIYGIYHHAEVMENLRWKEDVHLPTLVECKAEVAQEKPKTRALNTKQYAYYEELAAQDLRNKTPEDIQRSMIKAMQEDGLKPVKIHNIAMVNPDFKQELLPIMGKTKAVEANKEQLTAKEKLQEKMAGQTRQKAICMSV